MEVNNRQKDRNYAVKRLFGWAVPNKNKSGLWLQGDMVSKEDGCIQMRVEHVFKMMEEMREK